MIDDLKPYSEMKDSGLPWLGAMPAHWEVQRNGKLFGQHKRLGFRSFRFLKFQSAQASGVGMARVIVGVMKDDPELFKQYSDNPDFKRWLADTVFGMTY